MGEKRIGDDIRVFLGIRERLRERETEREREREKNDGNKVEDNNGGLSNFWDFRFPPAAKEKNAPFIKKI